MRSAETPPQRVSLDEARERAERLIARGDAALLDRPQRDQTTLAIVAALHNDLELLTRLADAGARTVSAPPTLFAAILGGHCSAVEWVLDRGRLPTDDPDLYRESPLVHAVRACQLPVVELLLARGADVTVLDRRGQPLPNAISPGLTGMPVVPLVRLLLAHHAPVQASALCVLIAEQADCAELLELLLTQYGASALFEEPVARVTALMRACFADNVEAARVLLAHGAATDFPDFSLLSIAAEGSTAMVELLLAHGANPEPENDDMMPLKRAVFAGKAANAKLLIDAGADVHHVGADGATVLHFAANSGSIAVMDLLLPLTLDDLEREDLSGETPLMYCCNSENSACDAVLEKLINAGARFDVTTAASWSPLTMLVANKRFGGMRMLLDRGVDPHAIAPSGTTLLYFAAQVGNLDLIKQLVTPAGVPYLDQATVAESDEIGETAFYNAAWSGHEACVRFLAAAGANINLPTAIGTTPLEAAVRNGHEAVIRALLELGAEVGSQQRLVREAIEKRQLASLLTLVACGVCDDFDGAIRAIDLWEQKVFPLATVLLWLGATTTAPGVPRGIVDAFTSTTPIDLQEPYDAAWAALCVGVLRDVATRKLRLINPVALNACLALQDIELPALLTLAIVDELCPFAPLVPMHLKWRMVTAVKHFNRAEPQR